MSTRWVVALILGLVLMVGQVAPALAGFEGGDPGQGHAYGHENPNNNHKDPDHGPKP